MHAQDTNVSVSESAYQHTLSFLGRGSGKCAEPSCQRVWSYLFLLLYAYVDIYKANRERKRRRGLQLVQITFCIYDPSANAMDDKVFLGKNKIFRHQP